MKTTAVPFVTDPCRIRSINFESEKPPFVKRKDIEHYYFDERSNVYGDVVSDLVCVINERSAGKTIRRLEACYDAVFLDELQDLVSYDLEFMELLFKSSLLVVAVGDPRQFTYATSKSAKNKKYRGIGLYEWVRKVSQNRGVAVEYMNWSYRCNQSICDFADRLYPEHPPTESRNDDVTGHDGVFLVHADDLDAYMSLFQPTALRWDKRSSAANESGLAASNIGMVKGCTFARVLVFPTNPMLAYLRGDALEASGSVAKLYVAVTRAKSSVAFVVKSREFQSALADMWSPSS